MFTKNALLLIFITVFGIPCKAQERNQKIFSAIARDYKLVNKDEALISSVSLDKTQFGIEDDTLILKLVQKSVFNNQIYVITAINPRTNDCHSCAPILGIAVFSDTLATHLASYNQVEKVGSWGELPVIGIKKIDNTDEVYFMATPGYSAQGYTSENIVIYRRVNKQFGKVFEMDESYLDNYGVCDEEQNNCYQKKTQVTLHGNKLITKTTGTEFDFEKNAIVPVNIQKTYSFRNGKYVVDAD
jgi:hypothetical protein